MDESKQEKECINESNILKREVGKCQLFRCGIPVC